MHPLEIYLEELRAIRFSGAADPETSGYGALSKLLNAAGHALKPKVRCFISLRNRGAGKPDGGLFTPDQVKNSDEAQPLLGIPQPSRGVIEVKGTKDELADIIGTQQVLDYLEHYGQLLLTNYRDFLLLKRGKAGIPVRLESFRLAESEASFWRASAAPRKAASLLGERCLEYLKRVLLHAAPLNDPKDVAFFVASYARDARARVENAGDLPALAGIRNALEQALGMKFEQEKGEHFFRSTLVQTLFYGVFSAWVLWHKAEPLRKDAFDWRAAAWNLRVPMIKALFEQVATPTKLGPLGLVEVLDWTAAALNRVDRTEFFARFAESRAVQYFYEPFLEAFDPKLRKELGVWYTPSEIVEYQVARVDTVLREELDIADGLADPRVYVLDPCCGTGAYLVAVLRRIVQTLKEEKGEGALAQLEAKQAAMKRVYGFEIMPAPFVVAHLQMGLLLQSLGAPLDENNNERAGIFLTNSLTGWDFAGDNPHLANWPELEAERKGAGVVKQKKPILVILGNPPYNAYAGVSPEEEQGLVEPYKDGLVRQWGIRRFNLDDLYVRFFRLAERRIAEKTGQGIVSYISNFSYLGGPSFVVMRQRFLKEFDTLWFDCLNGDSRETGKLTPDGKPDPSVFSTDHNREGIRVGTAVSMMVRTPKRSMNPQVYFRQFWGTNKRAEIVESLQAKDFTEQYEKVAPAEPNKFSFRSFGIGAQYVRWPKLSELCSFHFALGILENRKDALNDISRDALIAKMKQYFDPSLPLTALGDSLGGLKRNMARFDAAKCRSRLLASEVYDPKNIRRYMARPFDDRWCYYSSTRPLWNECRLELAGQLWEGNLCLISRRRAFAAREGLPMFVTRALGNQHAFLKDAYYLPIRLRGLPKRSSPRKNLDDGNGKFDSILHEAAPAYGGSGTKTTANLSPAARAYLAKLGINNPDADANTAALLWMHALAIGYSPAYLSENADGVRQDWPRIPLPNTKAALLASAEIGKQLAALLDSENHVPGVTSGKLRAELKTIAVLSSTANLSLTAGWGHAGQGGVTMPGKGKVETRAYQPDEAPPPEATAPFGLSTYDVYLNDTTCWRNIPINVWAYNIGGYQVIKKWLSYREHDLLGRALATDEAREVTHTARRLAALLLSSPRWTRITGALLRTRSIGNHERPATGTVQPAAARPFRGPARRLGPSRLGGRRIRGALHRSDAALAGRRGAVAGGHGGMPGQHPSD